MKPQRPASYHLRFMSAAAVVVGRAAVNFRVLLVEDEELVSLFIEGTLADLGCSVVGPATSVVASLTLLDIEHIDLALIDLPLRGELGLSVADALVEKAIPFAFITGYSSEIVRGTRYGEVPVLSQPFSMLALTKLVHQLGSSATALARARHRTVH